MTVTAGSATAYNPVLTSGSTLKVTASTDDGAPIGNGYLSVYNAVTGDIMGSAWVGADGAATVPVFGPQQVKIGYIFNNDDAGTAGWYGGADQQDAETVAIPADGSVTITINTN